MADGIRTLTGTRGGWYQAPRDARRSGVAGESTLTVRGTKAALLWGWHEAITLKAWAIYKVKGEWMLTATMERVDPFQSRQRPLLFTAPRPGGFWAWSVSNLDIGARQLRATLGPPER